MFQLASIWLFYVVYTAVEIYKVNKVSGNDVYATCAWIFYLTIKLFENKKRAVHGFKILFSICSVFNV